MLLAFFDKDVTIKDADWKLSPIQTNDFGKPLSLDEVYFGGV